MFVIGKPVKYDDAKKDLLTAVAKNDTSKIETALKKLDQVPKSEKDSKEEKQLRDLADSKKETLKKQERIDFME